MPEVERRKTDAKAHERLDALERRFGAMEVEIQTNTRITQEIRAHTDEMYELFDGARAGFRMLGSIGNAGLKVIQVGGKVARPLVWIAALLVAGVGFFKTGHFTLPDWIK